jgi:hypothetical protein
MELSNEVGFIKLDFDVAAPVEHGWSFGLQADKIPKWQFDVVAVRGISGQIDRKGTRYTLVYRKAGILLNSPVEVSRYETENLAIETMGRTPLGGCFRSCTRMRRNAHRTDAAHQTSPARAVPRRSWSGPAPRRICDERHRRED